MTAVLRMHLFFRTSQILICISHNNLIVTGLDGREGVLIIPEQDAGEIKAGALVWLSTSDAAPVVLPVMGASNLHWGLPPRE